MASNGGSVCPFSQFSTVQGLTPSLQPSLPKMLSQGLRLKISILWFQRLKSNGHELQKSNASLRVDNRARLEP